MSAKRKRDDEPSEAQGSTVFVSNLPYNATSVDLQTFFSDIAPVKSAFVVLDKELKTSKGVGYVSFAIREDAQKAVQSQTMQMNGRPLRLEWPGAKSPIDVASIKPRPPRQANLQRPDPHSIRTIFVSGLPGGIDSKTLWKKIRKYDGAEKVEWPGKNTEGMEDPTVASAIFATPAQAMAASERLHAHIYKGAQLSVTLKKRLDHLMRKSGGPSRSSRLIVRNIPWNTDERLLRSLFLTFGPIHSIHIPPPNCSEGDPKPKARGFAFVWMLSHKDAEKALEGINGAILGEATEQRVVAVDWALSKERWEKERSDHPEEHDVGSDIEDQGEEKEEGPLGIHEGASGDSDSSSSDVSSENPEEEDIIPPIRPQLPMTDVGTTLFIRNLPFNATEEELRLLFRAFGPLRYARITVDHEGRSRGTGFVCFWNKEDADKTIAQAELLLSETGVMPAKRNPFTFPSLLTPDPSSSLAQSLVLHGRTLDVSRAVTREAAAKLKEQGERQREKEDKRNLYLMREGVIFPNMPGASTISAVELDKRVTAFNERRALLRSNPSLFISKTRLSVRQLPTFATERTLKRLGIYAIKAFEKEVAEGLRSGLSTEELNTVGGEESDADSKRLKKRKRGERPTPVKQAKIVRQQDRIDPVTGKGKSKGYGFLELNNHVDSLRVLRWSNNNPAVLGLLEGWWKQEMEDLLKRLEKELKEKKSAATDEDRSRIKRLKERIESGKTEGGGGKRTLVLEYAIENIVVVKRRRELTHEQPKEEGEPSRKRQKLDHLDQDSLARTHFKRRIQKQTPTELIPHSLPEPSSQVKPNRGQTIGGMIGMKRRQRRIKAQSK